MTTSRHAKITDDLVARARSRIGQVWRPSQEDLMFSAKNTQATWDNIKRFVNAVGDANPLYRDPEYAQKTRYGRLVAPGCFLFSIYGPTGQGGFLPGLHNWYAGNDFVWFKSVFEGDKFNIEVSLTDFVEKQSRSGGRVYMPHDECVYYNQRREVVGKCKGWGFVVERGAAGERGKYRQVQKAQYTPEELAKIDSDYEKEVIRGAEVRFWEDVQVGAELPPLVKGPHAVVDILAHIMGFGSPYFRAYGLRRTYEKRHPEARIWDETAGEYTAPDMVHINDNLARQLGTPGAYDYGPGRISQLAQLLTNWMGDDGWLWKLRAELRLFRVVGDTTWFKGKVQRKYVENGEHCVDIECWCENQRGEITMPGQATVILPSKAANTWPLERRVT